MWTAPVPQTEDLSRRHQAGEHPDHLVELGPVERLCLVQTNLFAGRRSSRLHIFL